jgi:hypothetical protein
MKGRRKMKSLKKVWPQHSTVKEYQYNLLGGREKEGNHRGNDQEKLKEVSSGYNFYQEKYS